MLPQKLALSLLLIFAGCISVGNSAKYPLINNRQPKTSITIGSCTWVLDRQCPDYDINFFLFTRKNLHDRQYIHVDETSLKSNISSSHFNPRNPTKIIIHGYNSDMYLRPLINMKDEYLQIRDYNLFYVDWSKLSTGPCYFSAVHNTRHVGKCIAQLIERILEEGSANIHIIGFSLGAQVPNFVAQSLGSFVIPRITGLDPAMPLFITASADEKLDPSDAAFVDVIHTNAFVQGKVERCGHADFYMNGGVIQPGCGNNPFACSHHRAADYFTESIRSFKGFWGWPCSSYISYLLGLCPPTNNLVQAGEHCSSNTQGMFLVSTNGEEPFAKGKWPEYTKKASKKDHTINSPFNHHNPMQAGGAIDQWGKLDSSFNNLGNFPTPFPQDLTASNWPYFSDNGYTDMTETLRLNSDVEEKLNLLNIVHQYDAIVSDKKKEKNSDASIRENKFSNSVNSKFEVPQVVTENQMVQRSKDDLIGVNAGLESIQKEVFGLPKFNEH